MWQPVSQVIRRVSSPHSTGGCWLRPPHSHQGWAPTLNDHMQDLHEILSQELACSVSLGTEGGTMRRWARNDLPLSSQQSCRQQPASVK